MKSKNFSKKLTLNKNTIADLNMDKMRGVYGGKDAPPIRETDQVTCCLAITGCCPTECTCGTGDPLCNCVSR
jgi:hypothetical protein